MGIKEEMDLARKRDYRGQRLMILVIVPLSVIGFVLMYLDHIPRIEYQGVYIWGTAKYIWFFTMEVFVGMSMTFCLVSFFSVVFLTKLVNELKTRSHPLRIMILPTLLLLVSGGLVVAGIYLESLVRRNVTLINDTLSFLNDGNSVFGIVFDGLWFVGSACLFWFFVGVNFLVGKFAFDGKKVAEFMRSTYQDRYP